MATPGQNQPEASAGRAVERIQQETGDMLKPSIFDRLIEQESPAGGAERERDRTKRETLTNVLVQAASNENIPLEDRRQMVNSTIIQLSQSMGEEGVREEYGHVVLDQLENILEPEDEPNRVEKLQGDFENVRGDIIPAEREKVMDTAINEGFEIPRTEEDIENIKSSHPYFYVENGVLRVRADIMHQHIEKLSGPPPLPGEAGQVMVRCREMLQQLETVDFTNFVRLVDHGPDFEQPDSVKNAANSIRMLVGLFFIAMATISMIMERNKAFPTFTAIYAGLAVLTLNPRMFSGELRTLRGQLEFVHTAGWDTLTDANKEFLTGERGEEFFEEMTAEAEIRSLYDKVEKGDLSSEEYYAKLEELGISERHMTFLRELEGRNKEQWTFLLSNIRRVQSPDAQTLLSGFAREGMNVASMGEIPTKQPVPVPETFADNSQVGQQFGGISGPLRVPTS
ncbi:hypothetical protein COU78_02775 [Candidatus Peregrinibacteria bacterium CG10_big_fil_rev_8_21_14_0_10_49_24]|nr:MAG: hypothetical protein COV83_02755 [Candidatus Peregrinibacteria bacterium CG11_big_fil_rev_8_21_14_0_20_49_14]PIR51059.1 MAG: hypothetical protein COU78_02775 [Candidatus Peregrinibacteria bacterium CG10_big_fil_rev_8_21_14_0_10_49_24]PJA67612.1 MAG: hypothetical protein CO157_04255 [Candidatus Peregrinibacteria bacterium CG_4_9_14_3_um_filter_49_12]